MSMSEEQSFFFFSLSLLFSIRLKLSLYLHYRAVVVEVKVSSAPYLYLNHACLSLARSMMRHSCSFEKNSRFPFPSIIDPRGAFEMADVNVTRYSIMVRCSDKVVAAEASEGVGWGSSAAAPGEAQPASPLGWTVAGTDGVVSRARWDSVGYCFVSWTMFFFFCRIFVWGGGLLSASASCPPAE